MQIKSRAARTSKEIEFGSGAQEEEASLVEQQFERFAWKLRDYVNSSTSKYVTGKPNADREDN